VNTVKDLRQTLSEEVRRLQAPPGLETRVLQQALRSSAADVPAHRAGRQGAVRSFLSEPVAAPRLMGLVAVLLAAAIVISLVFAAQALHQTRSVPVKHAPIHGVATSKPIPVNPPTAMGCPPQAEPSDQCTTTALTLVSPNVIWAIVDSLAARPGETQGPSNIYRTDDGGQHWQAQASWDNPAACCPAEHMTVSPDGREALFVTPWGPLGSSVFHTADAGAHWTSYGIPATTQPTGLQTYFLNPREGWLVSKDPGSSADDLFHTTDSGANWFLLARVAAATNFDILHGQLVFQRSLGGWFVPDYSGIPLIARTVFRTVDGGLTWRPITLGALSVATRENKPGQYLPIHAAILDIKFFNDRQGVIELRNVDIPDPTYVYTTSDAGTTWSAPELIPSAVAIDFIDTKHWFDARWTTDAGLTQGILSRTDDGGRSWQGISSVLNGVALYGPAFHSIEFSDLSYGLAWVGCPAIAIGTVDGGAHWEPLHLPVKQQANGSCV
jgi:photosystem II stability/assembly factor-like uncharacterized protein